LDTSKILYNRGSGDFLKRLERASGGQW